MKRPSVDMSRQSIETEHSGGMQSNAGNKRDISEAFKGTGCPRPKRGTFTCANLARHLRTKNVSLTTGPATRPPRVRIAAALSWQKNNMVYRCETKLGEHIRSCCIVSISVLKTHFVFGLIGASLARLLRASCAASCANLRRSCARVCF